MHTILFRPTHHFKKGDSYDKYENNCRSSDGTWNQKNLQGYFFLIAALELAITDQKNLLYMSKSIFPIIASRYDTTYSCIERNIRTAINACWNSPDHREKLLAMSPYPLQKAPSVTAFIDILYWHLKNQEGGSLY